MRASRRCCSIRSISPRSTCSSSNRSRRRKPVGKPRRRAAKANSRAAEVPAMSLVKHVGTIGGLTMVSRIAGMAREMIFSRVLGANAVTDAWFQAFIIPNVFRRLFAEGAFSAAFVPMFSKRLHGAKEAGGGIESARSFSDDVLAVFLPALIALAALFEIAMPGVIWLLADKPIDPDGFDVAVDFARIMFPYIVLVSLVTLFTGMLNSVSRFA